MIGVIPQAALSSTCLGARKYGLGASKGVYRNALGHDAGASERSDAESWPSDTTIVTRIWWKDTTIGVMGLASGTQIGPYEIAALLGAGGHG